jgi:hypothetical protein
MPYAPSGNNRDRQIGRQIDIDRQKYRLNGNVPTTAMLLFYNSLKGNMSSNKISIFLEALLN